MQRLYPLGEPEAEGRLAVWLDPDNGESVIFPLKAGTPALETVPVIGCHADFWRPADFWCPATVTEVKTMQPYAWDKAQDEGPQLHHVLQAGLCALALEAGAIELVYIDKAKGRVAVFAVPDGWQALASTEASRLARLWPVGTIPEPMDYRRSVWQCKFCLWLTTCKETR